MTHTLPHPHLQTGDIIFIAIANPLYRRVARAIGSKASHVGIVFANPKRGWVVAESTIPFSKYTPLDRFLARSADGWCCVRRVKGGLGAEQARALRRACDARMGELYHFGFRYHSKRQFCSKLVYDAYRCALGIEIGQLQSFSKLLEHNPDQPLGFWRLWFFGKVPWSRLTVTPSSQLQSALLETVHPA